MRPYPESDDPRPIPGAGAVVWALGAVVIAALVAAILTFGR